MESSEVRSGSICRPGNSLQNEKIGYLAIESGTGSFNFDGDEIIYQFRCDYRSSPGTGNLSYKCDHESQLTDFNYASRFIMGKKLQTWWRWLLVDTL